MKTIEDQLSEALAKVTSLEADITAGADLLTEANAKVEAAQAELTTAQTALAEANTTIETLRSEAQIEADARAARETEIATLKADLIARTSEVETLKAEAKTAEQIAAERYGAGGPALAISGKPEGQADTGKALLEKFNAITDPKEQSEFWQGLTSAQKNDVLRANAAKKGA